MGYRRSIPSPLSGGSKYLFAIAMLLAATIVGSTYAETTRGQGIRDVLCQADGAVRGRVVFDNRYLPDVRFEHPRANVRLFQTGKLIASTESDLYGNFAIAVPRGGMYFLRVDVEDRAVVRCYRVWSPSAGPMKAERLLTVDMREATIIRGQSQRGETAKKTVFTAFALGGALATPLIYRATRDTTPIPTSP